MPLDEREYMRGSQREGEELLDPGSAPEQLDPAAGVRRLNKLPLVIVGGLILLVMVMLLIALQSRANRGQQQLVQQEQLPMLPESQGGYQKLLEEWENQEGTGVDQGVVIEAAPEDLGPPVPVMPPPTAAEMEIVKQRQEALHQALNSPTAVSLQRREAEGDGTDAGLATRPPSDGGGGQLDDLLRAVGGQGEADDVNLQARKEQFVDTARRFGYSSEPRTAPLTPYELRVGSVLPAVLLGGINSDLPGLVQAQVVQNVRDTRTGRHVLIPQGSRLIGSYDSRVSFGQRRVLVVWHRVMFPDASTLELGTMPGADQAGFAGVRDQVRSHFFRIFGSATLLSLIGAGAQLAQPQEDSQGTLSARELIIAEMAREWNQLGQEMIRRGMNVQPTLIIRPGYRFSVLVNKDLILEPYRPVAPVTSGR